MPEESTKPPCVLDPVGRYSVVRYGRVLKATNCIHKARQWAKDHQAQLWRRGTQGFPDMLVPL